MGSSSQKNRPYSQCNRSEKSSYFQCQKCNPRSLRPSAGQWVPPEVRVSVNRLLYDSDILLVHHPIFKALEQNWKRFQTEQRLENVRYDELKNSEDPYRSLDR